MATIRVHGPEAGNGRTNIMMRYKRVECNVWGNIGSSTPATKGCSHCASCKSVKNNPQSASDAQCAPCAMGKQSWWPCNVAGLCTCASAEGVLV